MAQTNREERSGPTVRKILATIANSTTLRVAVFGFLLILTGGVIEILYEVMAMPEWSAIWAAILPVWGLGLLISGLTIYLLIWWTYR